MSAKELDLQLGQLALARGMIDLSTLLRCATAADRDGQSFRDLLVNGGHLSQSSIEELETRLSTMSPEDVQGAVEAGETVVMQTLVENSQREGLPTLDSLLTPIESAVTMDGRPPTMDKGLPDSISALDTPRAEERYEFIDELGRGGMGQILLAEDHLLGRQIALKTILPGTTIERPQERLLAEAQVTGQLEHPSIVPVYELGRLSNDEPYYTMRVITEQDLASIIDELKEGRSDTPSLLQLVQIIRQVCLAVQYAHDHGVIHRDLKPENILVGKYGEVFVIDWGIAKILSHLSDAPSPTTAEDNQLGALVGTPQYMAPEQAHGENDAVDERTDVYALGAMLYEIMTLTPVFSSPTVLGLLMTIVQDEPEPPSQRAPHRSVPRPLEEICLRALSKEPAQRYPSAQALADELDLFIEGVKERDRQLLNARKLIERARQSRQHYDQARRQLGQAISERDRLRGATPAWADPEERAQLWERESQVETLQVDVERQFGQTVRLLSQSLGHTSLDEAHDALATLYWERFIDAERRGDRPMATYFENLVRQHDTGAFTDRLRGLADIAVATTPPEAQIILSRVRERQRRFVADEVVADGTSPLSMERLPHGRYQLQAEAPGFAPLQVPLVLDRQQSLSMSLRLFPNDAVPSDFVIISEGEFITGPPGEFGVDQSRESLPTYAIQRTPVTCAQYLEFLNDLADDDPDLAAQYAPRTQEEAPSYFPIEDGRYVIPERDADGDAWDPQWPIFIINFHDASAYARWRSERDGLTYRLPTSLEWEKAARGVDGRLYPWGDHFDPSFCRIRHSTPGKPMPAPVGSYRHDTSPYGVRDMAGNIAEWTSTPHENSPDTFLLRGGSFNSFPAMCRLDWYLNSPAAYRFSHYGFRLVLDI